MRMICVDDEERTLNLTVSVCLGLPQHPEVTGFTRALEALEYLREQTVDIALLEINLPDMDGLTLAARITEESPGTSVIFLTDYAEYAVDAFRLHVSGYLLKPVSPEQLAAEVDYALSHTEKKKAKQESHIAARTFGEFELLVDGETVSFHRTKSKELLAYLVDRHGGSVKRATIWAVLFEDRPYNRAGQKYLDVIIRSLRETLENYGAGKLLLMQRGSLRVNVELLDCDLYRFLRGEIDAINSYRGEYMSAYSWASLTEAVADRMISKTGGGK